MGMLSNIVLASLIVSSAAVESECAATTQSSEQVQLGSSGVEPSEAKDVVLMQVSHRAWQSLDAHAGAQDAPVVSPGVGVGKIQWVANDPYFDEDYTKDDQPGSADSTPAPNVAAAPANSAAAPADSTPAPPAPNVTAVQMKDAVLANIAAAPVNATAAPAGNGTAAAPANETVTTAAPTENVTAVPNTTEAPANATGCVTRKDPRASAWFAETSPEGTPCVFGVDVRDEGAHCIHDGGQFGSSGWCFTAKDRSTWGSCNENCPLYGAPAALGKKIDTIAKKLDGVADSLGGTAGNDESAEGAPAAAAPAGNASASLAAKEPAAKGK